MSDPVSTGAMNAQYWDELAGDYQEANRISVDDFHYGPLLAGDREIGLLPGDLSGLRSLEIGSGAGQNSLYLASRGADAIALDVSEEQLNHGRGLADQLDRVVSFQAADMDQFAALELGTFDIIHSTYALPFSTDPAALIKSCADHLKPGGTLLITTAHPLFAFDWMEFDNDEIGLFVLNYFHPPTDARTMTQSQAMSCARNWPISEILSWFIDAGLNITAVKEPQPLPIPTMSEEEVATRVPYFSEGWCEHFEEMQRVPVVLVIRAVKAG